MNKRFYCRECGQVIGVDDLIFRAIPPQFSEPKCKAIYDSIQYEFSHVDCPRGDVMDLGIVPDIANIIGIMPDLPDGFPRDDETWTTPPECLINNDKQQNHDNE